MRHARIVALAALSVAVGSALPTAAEAQGRGNQGRSDGAAASVTLSVELKSQIQEFYTTRPATNAQALPPGIRRNLERGKPLPPGIAKKTAPPELTRRIELRDGFELVEVGLDVLLVEVATNVIHDVLMDIIR